MVSHTCLSSQSVLTTHCTHQPRATSHTERCLSLHSSAVHGSVQCPALVLHTFFIGQCASSRHSTHVSFTHSELLLEQSGPELQPKHGCAEQGADADGSGGGGAQVSGASHDATMSSGSGLRGFFWNKSSSRVSAHEYVARLRYNPKRTKLARFMLTMCFRQTYASTPITAWRHITASRPTRLPLAPRSPWGRRASTQQPNGVLHRSYRANATSGSVPHGHCGLAPTPEIVESGWRSV